MIPRMRSWERCCEPHVPKYNLAVQDSTRPDTPSITYTNTPNSTLPIAANMYGGRQSSDVLHYATFNTFLDALTALFKFVTVRFYGI